MTAPIWGVLIVGGVWAGVNHMVGNDGVVTSSLNPPRINPSCYIREKGKTIWDSVIGSDGENVSE